MKNNSQREKNIIRSVYRYETKQTVLYYIQTFLFYCLLGVLLYGFVGTAYDLLIAYDILYLPASLTTMYEMATFAVPLWAQMIIILLVILLIALVMHTIRNAGIVFAKLRGIITYWYQEGRRGDSQT